MPTFFTDPATAKKEQLIKRLKIREIRAFGFSSDEMPLLAGNPVIIEKYDVNGELVESYAFWEGTSEVSMTVSTDERGNKIKTYCYDDMEFHVYDSSQRLIERRLYNEKGRIRERVRYEYENPSALIEIRREYSRKNKYLGKSVCKSDELGNTLFEAFFDESGDPISKCSCLYDDTFRIVRTIEWGVLTRRARGKSSVQYLGMLYSDYRYQYDNLGNLVEKLCHKADETIDWNRSEFYKYDRNNRKIEESGVNEDGRTAWKLTFGYDTAGNLASTIFSDADGSMIHSKAWLYDEQGLISELVLENPEDELCNRYLYSYEYY